MTNHGYHHDAAFPYDDEDDDVMDALWLTLPSSSSSPPTPLPFQSSSSSSLSPSNLITNPSKIKMLEQSDVHFDLLEKFEKVANFIKEKKSEIFERAPDAWMKPVLPNCESCGRKHTKKPLITKKKGINWLFLLLGEMIGCCNLMHLKYFCKQHDIHRSGAKNRLLYQTYLGLCKQLQPQGPFDP